jgi:transposase
MADVEQLTPGHQSLMEMILRERAEVQEPRAELQEPAHQPASAPDDTCIEQVRREAAAAIALRDEAIAQRDAAIAERDAAIEQIKREAAEQIEALKQSHQVEIAALLRRFYGPRNERFDPEQILLFGDSISPVVPSPAAAQTDPAQKPTRAERRRHKHGRQKLPPHLERVPVECDLKGEKKACPCCGKVRRCIGKVMTEVLEFFPACFKVLEMIQHKYCCDDCESNGLNPQIELAPKPPQPIEKGLAGPGLVANVITSKCADHLPLYRIEQIFERHGVHIADSTMCGWIEQCAALVAPLVLLMKKRAKQSKVIKTDETRVPVQHKKPHDKLGTGQCKKGRMWAYLGDWHNPYIIFEYTPDRTNQWPLAWLEGFFGFLQADAYSGYDAVYEAGIVIEIACWTHGRRYFFNAKDTDTRRSGEMLEMIGQLYGVEDKAKEQIAELPHATEEQKNQIRRDLRQQHSKPVLDKIKAWLDKESKLVLPRSPMAKAINYMLNQWQALCVYAEYGFLDIDNNGSERALKLIAIGRRNWLFVGNNEFGKHYAAFYSLIASAKLHGLDPQAYLRHVLAHIMVTPMSELEQFLPDVYKAQLQAGKIPLPIGASPRANAFPPANGSPPATASSSTTTPVPVSSPGP